MEVGAWSRVKRAARHLMPQYVVKSALTRRMVQQFAHKYGLVYFGYVDNKSDEHELVRGHTLSRSIIDTHYSTGTVQGYDVAFVQRNDLALLPSGEEQRCHWLIVSIKLHNQLLVPHFYVGPTGGNAIFSASYTQLHHARLGHTATYSPKFLSNFSVFSRPSDVIDLEHALPPAVADVLVSYFPTMPFEVEGNTLYIYSENRYPNSAALDTMLENGIWLAKQLDAHAGPVNDK